MSEPYHVPVLCKEVVDSLIIDRGGVYVDGTVGGGGHAERICSMLSGQGRLVCFDADADAIRHAARRLEQFGAAVALVHANVRTLKAELQSLGVGQINGLFLDLGVSSYQLDEASKGFSFRGDDRLDMRMDRRQSINARDIINTSSEAELADLIWRYGEERNSRRIARRIVLSRPIETTGSLASVIESVVGARFLSKSLARVFQALRIAVNDELRSLEQTLTDAVDLLQPRGRVVVISYHSLEDRVVKDFFRSESAARIPSGHKYLPDIRTIPRLRVVTKKPIQPSVEEVARNPRARSAKLRVAERIEGEPASG
jgi:16S rRNA (cytosine1402-N4)-methyltransferase